MNKKQEISKLLLETRMLLIDPLNESVEHIGGIAAFLAMCGAGIYFIIDDAKKNKKMKKEKEISDAKKQKENEEKKKADTNKIKKYYGNNIKIEETTFDKLCDMIISDTKKIVSILNNDKKYMLNCENKIKKYFDNNESKYKHYLPFKLICSEFERYSDELILEVIKNQETACATSSQYDISEILKLKYKNIQFDCGDGDEGCIYISAN